MTGKWISVGERLPQPHERVIGWRDAWFRPAEVWLTDDGEWLGGDYERAGAITHWMPLPSPPAS